MISSTRPNLLLLGLALLAALLGPLPLERCIGAEGCCCRPELADTAPLNEDAGNEDAGNEDAGGCCAAEEGTPPHDGCACARSMPSALTLAPLRLEATPLARLLEARPQRPEGRVPAPETPPPPA